MKALLAKTGGRQIGWHAALEFNVRDCCVGVFWRQDGCCVDVWLSLLPMLPLHLSWWWVPKEQP